MIERLVVGAISTNCWIVAYKDGGKRSCAVIDPGGDGEEIIARLKRLDLIPEHILLTHGHFDHLAALPDLVAAYGQSAAPPIVAVHRADAAYLGPSALGAHRRDFSSIGALSYVTDLWKDQPRAGRLLEDGDRIGPFKVLHLPGHTPGSVAFLLEEEGTIFTGDTLFADGVGRVDLPGGDGRALTDSLRRLFALDGNLKVLSGHGGRTTIGRER